MKTIVDSASRNAELTALNASIVEDLTRFLGLPGEQPSEKNPEPNCDIDRALDYAHERLQQTHGQLLGIANKLGMLKESCGSPIPEMKTSPAGVSQNIGY